ncbi:MAG: methyltransferase domain-containing protein [Pseudonocardiales bacterium]|nr:methyltransferase domain-containing protein [Pseudonocardiales bacterium]
MTGAGYSLRLSDAEVTRYRLMAERARQDEVELWRMAGITAGARIADIGCGPGATLVTMAEIVGPAGAVVGVDADPEAVERAALMIEHSGLSNARVCVGGAEETGLPTGSFDTVVIRHVLAHNGGRERAIVDHAVTLLRPQGRLHLVDTEASAIRAWPPAPDYEAMNNQYIAFNTAQGNDLRVGLRLADLLSEAGLEVLGHEGWFSRLAPAPGTRPPAWAARDAMVASGFASAADIASWDAGFTAMDASGTRPAVFVSTFGAVGRRAA